MERPHSNEWFVGTTDYPENDVNASKAIEGDFYLNRMSGNVYQKKSTGEWMFLFGMKSDSSSDEKVYHTVFFNPGVGKINGNSSILMSSILEGQTMKLSQIPTPTCDEQIFVGWYTDKTNVNAGKFTDLTPVLSDLTLYARYE